MIIDHLHWYPSRCYIYSVKKLTFTFSFPDRDHDRDHDRKPDPESESEKEWQRGDYKKSTILGIYEKIIYARYHQWLYAQIVQSIPQIWRL